MITNSQYGVRETRTQNHAANPARPGWMQQLREWLAVCNHRAQERAQLRVDLDRLDNRALRDIGVSREDLVAEAAKPFWRE